MALLDKILTKKLFSLTPPKYDPVKGTLQEMTGEKFEIDAVISENEGRSVSVTNYPLESGASFAEHANQLAFNLSVSGIISDTSLSYFDTATNFGGSTIGSLLGYPSKSQKAYDTITKWASTGQPLLVRTKFQQQGYYRGTGFTKVPVPFVIESLAINRTKDVGSAISFALNLREIRLVPNIKNKTIFLPVIPTEIPPATDKGSAGPSPGTKANAAAAKNANPIAERAAILRDSARSR